MIMSATMMSLKTNLILLALWTPQVLPGVMQLSLLLMRVNWSVLMDASFFLAHFVLARMMRMMAMVEESLVEVVREGVEDLVRISYFSVGTFLTFSIVLNRHPLHPLMRINCCILDWAWNLHKTYDFSQLIYSRFDLLCNE